MYNLSYTRVSEGRAIFARYHNVALQVWLAQCDETDALALAQASRQMQEEFPDGISTVHWLRNNAALPTPGARQHFAHMMDTQADWFGDVAMLLDGDGFWAGAVRGMLTGLRLAAGKRAGFRVFSEMGECTAWLAPQHERRTGVRLEGLEIANALRTIAAAHG